MIALPSRLEPAPSQPPITLADIFTPQPGGRSIVATTVPGVGTRLTYVDGRPGDAWLLEHSRNWANFDRCEIEHDEVLILVAASQWRRFSTQPLWVVGYQERSTTRGWILQSDNRLVWDMILLDLGCRFLAEAETTSGIPHSTLAKK